LSENKIEELPVSVSEMTQLEFVNVGCNRLRELPVDFGPRNLKYFNASNNQLHRLPDGFRLCQNLEVLNLDGNILDASFWSMAGLFVKLRELLPNRQS
jgi:Leucine-rich repeat (LRR) protein